MVSELLQELRDQLLDRGHVLRPLRRGEVEDALSKDGLQEVMLREGLH